MGNIQVTALGFYDYAQCKIHAYGSQIAGVRCFAPNGTLVDVAFTVPLGVVTLIHVIPLGMTCLDRDNLGDGMTWAGGR